jgi:tripartite-type tricarboxylate transporter receptor subunit TctC
VAALSLWIAGQSPVLSQQINLVVPYAAGGPTDVTARLLGERMSRSLGQIVVVENVTGAGGTLASARVARTPPGGMTILIHHNALAAAPALYSNLALQLPFLSVSESMGNHDSEIVDASSVD